MLLLVVFKWFVFLIIADKAKYFMDFFRYIPPSSVFSKCSEVCIIWRFIIVNIARSTIKGLNRSAMSRFNDWFLLLVAWTKPIRISKEVFWISVATRLYKNTFPKLINALRGSLGGRLVLLWIQMQDHIWFHGKGYSTTALL